MTKTIEDVWKHVSNKITNKVNNVWEDLEAMIIPVDADGNFMAPIKCSDKPEYEGDSYSMIRSLCWTTELLPTGTFAYVCPARARQAPTEMDPTDDPNDWADLIKTLPFTHVLTMSVVNPIGYDPVTDEVSPNIEHGVWWVERNEFEALPVGEEGPYGAGQLPVALGSLSFKWAVDNNQLGAISNDMREAIELARQSMEKAKAVFNRVR